MIRPRWVWVWEGWEECRGEEGCSHVGVEGGTFCNGHCVGESSTPTHWFGFSFYGTISSSFSLIWWCHGVSLYPWRTIAVEMDYDYKGWATAWQHTRTKYGDAPSVWSAARPVAARWLLSYLFSFLSSLCVCRIFERNFCHRTQRQKGSVFCKICQNTLQRSKLTYCAYPSNC